MASSKELKVIINLEDNASKKIPGLTKSFLKAGVALEAIKTAANVAVKAVGKLVDVGKESAVLAGRFETVSDAFNGMAKDFGIGSEQIIKDVRKATRNTVDDLTIITNANTAMSLIGKEAFSDFGTEFVQLAEISKKASRATGQEVSFMFDSIVRGIGRSSPLILDNLGLTIKASEVYDAYAETLGKSASDLTSVEQKQALLNAVIAQGNEKFAEVSVSSGGFQGKVQELNATITNIKLTIGQQLLPILTPLAEMLLKLIQKAGELARAVGEELSPHINSLREALSTLSSQVNLTSEDKELLFKVIKTLVKNGLIVMIKTVELLVKGLSFLIEKGKQVNEGFIQPSIENFQAFIGTVREAIGVVQDLISKVRELASKAKGKIGEKLGFKHGGVVPGGFNEAVPAVLHGGERVIPRTGTDVNTGGGAGAVTVNFNAPIGIRDNSDIEAITKAVQSALNRENALYAMGGL